jgi:hypothetical protein
MLKTFKIFLSSFVSLWAKDFEIAFARQRGRLFSSGCCAKVSGNTGPIQSRLDNAAEPVQVETLTTWAVQNLRDCVQAR